MRPYYSFLPSLLHWLDVISRLCIFRSFEVHEINDVYSRPHLHGQQQVWLNAVSKAESVTVTSHAVTQVQNGPVTCTETYYTGRRRRRARRTLTCTGAVDAQWTSTHFCTVSLLSHQTLDYRRSLERWRTPAVNRPRSRRVRHLLHRQSSRTTSGARTRSNVRLLRTLTGGRGSNRKTTRLRSAASLSLSRPWTSSPISRHT
jgi:hypothetical protein